MAENNFSSLAPDPQQVPQTPPPPPAAESLVGVRTMAGDISSLNSSGGMEPQPQTFNPRDIMNNEPAYQPQSASQSGAAAQPGSPSLVPSQADSDAYRAHHKKMLVISASIVGLVVILGASAYFLLFRGPATCPAGQTGTPPNCVTPPPAVLSATINATPSTINEGEITTLSWDTTNAVDVIIDGLGGVEPKGTKEVTPTESVSYHLIARAADGTSTDATVQVTVIPKSTTPPFEHKSMFPASSTVTSTNLSLSAMVVDEFKTALRAAAGAEVTFPVLKEFVTVLPDGQVDAFKFFPVFLPSVAAPFVMPIERDFTGFFYKDANGVWPGFVMTVPAATDPSTFLQEIEKSPAVFFLDDPGAPKAAAFQDGTKFTPNVLSVRYLAYAKTGASLNIAIVKIADKNYIMVSTSFNGTKEAAKKLGF